MSDPFASAPLPADFVPGDQTVVVELPFPRNQHLLRLLSENREAYRAANDEEGKQRILQRIVEQMRRSSGIGIGFVIQSEDGKWKALLNEAGCRWWVGVAFQYLADNGPTVGPPPGNHDADDADDDDAGINEPLSVRLDDSEESSSSLDFPEAHWQDIISRLRVSSPTPQAAGRTTNATGSDELNESDSSLGSNSSSMYIRECDVVMKEKSLRNTTEGTVCYREKCKKFFNRSKGITYEEVFEKQKELTGLKQSDPICFWIHRDKLNQHPDWALEASLEPNPNKWMVGYLEKGIYKGKTFVLASEACILHDIRSKRRKSDKEGDGGASS